MNSVLTLEKTQRIINRLWENTKGQRLVILLKVFYGFMCWPLLTLATSILNEGKLSVEGVWYHLVLGIYMFALQLFWIELILYTLGVL